MKKIVVQSEFFNIKDTLECGQIFRFVPFKRGFLVFSLDKCAYSYADGDSTVIETNDGDQEYFKRFFDLERDYSAIYQSALTRKEKIIVESANVGKGIRILNQDPTETLFSFIISQNNNIPRIKKTIESLCRALGEKKSFDGYEYFAFPSAKSLAGKEISFFREAGLGYRAEYIKSLAEELALGFNLTILPDTSYQEVKQALMTIKGVGPKVADCVALFGYHKTKAFPVDTWIEKVYIEDFNGKLKDRNKISEFFINEFGENSGYYQQYLFFYKRDKQKIIKKLG